MWAGGLAVIHSPVFFFRKEVVFVSMLVEDTPLYLTTVRRLLFRKMNREAVHRLCQVSKSILKGMWSEWLLTESFHFQYCKLVFTCLLFTPPALTEFRHQLLHSMVYYIYLTKGWNNTHSQIWPTLGLESNNNIGNHWCSLQPLRAYHLP